RLRGWTAPAGRESLVWDGDASPVLFRGERRYGTYKTHRTHRTYPFSEVLGSGARDHCMSLRFTVLASGSGGNASLVESDGAGVLIDAGLGPRQLAGRFADSGLSWSAVHAVVLTHTHTDHWKDTT